MEIKSDIHIHTNYCDGKNSPEEMVQAAIEKGFTCLGFSGHCHTPFDESYAMSLDNTDRYCKTILGLQKKYKGIIDILMGTEWDYYAEIQRENYDFIIGSVHYIRSPLTEKYYPVDYRREDLQYCLQEGFGGDIMAMLHAYYDSVADMAQSGQPTILGHFDLIRKLNKNNILFDENSPDYLRIALEAVDRVVEAGVVIEVNSGAVYRNYCDTPYPADPILKRVAALGGRVILSSDAHDTKSIGFLFPEMEKQLAQLGFSQIQVMTVGGVMQVKEIKEEVAL